jgi:hypothetical protein
VAALAFLGFLLVFAFPLPAKSSFIFVVPDLQPRSQLPVMVKIPFGAQVAKQRLHRHLLGPTVFIDSARANILGLQRRNKVA